MILSHGLWVRHFGGSVTALGEAVRLGGQPYTVIGVIPPDFQSFPPVDAWTPFRPDPPRRRIELPTGWSSQTEPIARPGASGARGARGDSQRAAAGRDPRVRTPRPGILSTRARPGHAAGTDHAVDRRRPVLLHRVLQHSGAAAGASVGAPPRDRPARGTRRGPGSHHPAALDGKLALGRVRVARWASRPRTGGFRRS